MARNRTPSEIADKAVRNITAATEEMRVGVSRVTEAPGAKAAAKQDKMKRNLVEAIDNGEWARRVSGVTLQEWQKAMVEKGIPRISAGVEAARQKMEEFHAQLQSHQETINRKLETMPDLTLEDNIARMTYQVREMKKFKRR